MKKFSSSAMSFVCSIAFLMLHCDVSNAKAEKTMIPTLANPEDFIMISETEDSEHTVFLSYTGESFNHCGVALRWHSANGKAIQEALTIFSGNANVGVIEGYGMVGRVFNPKAFRYGQQFTIKAKSGRSLKEVISALNEFVKVEVIVEILPCIPWSEWEKQNTTTTE